MSISLSRRIRIRDTGQTFSESTSAASQLGIHYSVVRLHSWPELTRLPREVVPDLARICALLAVRPTAVSLIPRLLSLPKERVSHMVEILHVQGHLQEGVWVDPRPDHHAESGFMLEGDEIDALDDQGAAMGSVKGITGRFARMWTQLSGAER